MSFARQAIKIIAAMVCSTAVVFCTLFIAAPAAQAAPSPDIFITNSQQFNDSHTGRLRVKVGTEWGKSVRVYAGQRSVGFKATRNGWAEFLVGRERFKNHSSTTVTVKVYRDGRTLYAKRFTVKDVPRPKVTPGEKVVKVAKAQVGERYKFGADGPSSFDCSGLVQYAYKKATGKNLPHSSSAIKERGRRVARGDARPGDVVWTSGHVAIYAGGGKVVEAATPRTGVTYRMMWQSNPQFIRI